MIPYVSNAELTDIADRIRSARRVMVTTHTKPDGDAVGSSTALTRALNTLPDCTADLWFIPPLGEVFETIVEPTPFRLVSDDQTPDDDYDLIIILDTGAGAQLQGLKPFLAGKADRICVLDHHIQGDSRIADLRYIRPDAAAASEIVAGLIEAMGIPLTRELAEPLYVGLAADTGWFRFSNTRAETLMLAGRLLQTGVNHSALYRLIQQTDRPQRYRLMAKALASLSLHAADRIAVMALAQEDYHATGATTDESHGFSDMLLGMESVEVACLISEPVPGIVKLSLRSKDGPNAVDVNALAGHFGGGGHARASGAKVERMPLHEVRLRFVAAAEKSLP